jgi:flagellar hook-associated protein 2
MGISFSGLGSGLPVDDIVTKLIALENKPIDLLKTRQTKLKTQQLQYDSVRSRVDKLQTAITKLTDVTGNSLTASAPDLFRSSKISTSDDKRVTATASNEASPQSVDIEVTQLATATKVTSGGSGVGQVASGTSSVGDIAQGKVTAGSFTVFLNGSANSINIATTDTLDDVLGRVRAINPAVITGANVGSDGKLQITNTAGANIQLGASADTSNFLDLTQLKTGTKTSTGISANSALSTIALNKPVDSTDSRLATTVTAGSTFSIGKASFTTAGKSLNSLIAEINTSADSGVSASFNTSTNKLELVAKSSGSGLISLSDTTGNFLSAIGLISGSNSTINQTVGLNAQFQINGGSTQTSASNTVVDSVSGLTGITLNLTKAEVGAKTTVTVARNTDDLKTAIKDVINQYNQVLSFIDEQTKATNDKAELKNDSNLLRFRSDLRRLVSESVSGQPAGYGTGASAGLSTGVASTTASGSATTTLQLDDSKFDKALAENPDAIRNLFIGTNGIFNKLKTKITDATKDDPEDSKDGLFASKKTFIDNTTKALAKSITTGQDRVALKEKQLRLQFQQMDQLIAKYQSQGSALSRIGQ